MSRKLRIVHYLNQFYGQIGGEEAADVGFSIVDKAVGPGRLLENIFGDEAEVVATVICGDNYFAVRPQEAARQLLAMVKPLAPDVFIAGPAFAAGRYGIACGEACKTVGEALNIPVVTGMFEENPGVEMYRPHAYIVKTENTAAKMSDALNNIARITRSLMRNTHGFMFVTGFGIGTPEEEGYFPRMMIRNVFCEKSVATRSVDMVLAKICGKPYMTEMPYASFEKLSVASPITNINTARIAVVSDGGLVDKDNKGKISPRGCNVWTKYNIDDFFSPQKKSDDYYVAHTGYYGVDVIEDRARMVPYDILRKMENEKTIGALHNTYYVTCGNSTVARWCTRMGNEIAEELLLDKVDGVILTST